LERSGLKLEGSKVVDIGTWQGTSANPAPRVPFLKLAASPRLACFALRNDGTDGGPIGAPSGK
jgi:hypothetical protein